MSMGKSMEPKVKTSARNTIAYGFGTIGRDMVYALVSMYFIFYLTDIVRLTAAQLSAMIAISVAVRVFDAVNDPFMGVIVDNTKTRWGRFKPWIAIGAVLSAVATLLMFSGFAISGWGAVAFFGIAYVLWEICYTINDISYWSMLPTLSLDKKERERIGSVARIFANVGLFFAVVAIVPLTEYFGERLGGQVQGWFAFALIVAVIMVFGQAVTLFGAKSSVLLADKGEESTSLREMFSIIVKNDQLAIIAVSMALFMIGYTTTTTFGIYYFKYVYGDQGMYSAFALVLGVSQLAALSVFPALASKFRRESLYAASILLIAAGYILFFFAPTTTIIFVGAAGVLIFVGQGVIQILMLMFLTDTVDYGHWKFRKRNDSVTFSIQPFIYKVGAAVATGVVGAVAILSGAHEAESAADIAGGAAAVALSPGGILLIKIGMFIFPLISIAAGFAVFKLKYRLTKERHAGILADLREWGEIREINETEEIREISEINEIQEN